MNHTTQNLIVGCGISGLVCALELLKKNQKVTLIDSMPRDKIGGQARLAFGGMALIGTPEQKRLSIPDSPELAYSDWCSFAEFSDDDVWPKKWAKYYAENSRTEVYDYVKKLGVKFLPAVNWVERGETVSGNSVPRYHILWGSSLRLVEKVLAALYEYEGGLLTIISSCRATEFIASNGAIKGCIVESKLNRLTRISADNTIVACGGITGNIDKVKRHWPKNWQGPPSQILNGSLITNDGSMLETVKNFGARVTHLDAMWNYAAGVPSPEQEFEQQGLSLIPCKSALWLDPEGKRIMSPLVTGFDTRELCRRLSAYPFSWQILNRRIAEKELAVSGAEYNPMIRDRNLFGLLKNSLLGDKSLVSKMLSENLHFVSADNLQALSIKMNAVTDDDKITEMQLLESIQQYDQIVARGEPLWNDPQLRKITQLRRWKSERLRTCYPKPILDSDELIAIKLNLITRKSLGGIQTDLSSRVLDCHSQPINGLLAIGEAAGFGGGGANGKRSLEGTFLSGCILTARQAARYLTK